MEKRETSIDLLREPVFRRLWGSVELSFLGLFVHVVAGGWLMIELTASTTMVSLVQTAQALPIVLFSLLAGAAADTFDRRVIMVISLWIALAASALLVATAYLSGLGAWSILGLIFLVGSGTAIFTPAWQAALGDIAGRENLSAAVSLHNIGANVMRTLGPVLGGVLVATSGAGAAFAVGAASYLPALVSLTQWKPVRSADPHRESIASAMGAGLRYASVTPHVQTLLLRVLSYSLGAASVLALLPVIASSQLGLGADGYGVLLGGFGIGAIFGGFLQLRLRQRYSTETIVRSAFVLHAGGIVALAFSPSLMPGLSATVLCGSCWLTSHSIQNTHLQLSTPRWIVGRMVAMFLTAAFLGLAIGGWLWGALAEAAGLRAALLVSASVLVATVAMALRFPMPDISGLTLEPVENAGGKPIPAGVQPGTGPVHIFIHHSVDPTLLSEFRAVLDRRRRHFTRLGARQWTLLRDLEDPGHWTEMYQLRHWQDYQRLMKRRTSETLALRAEVRRLQLCGGEPRIEVMGLMRIDARIVDLTLRP